MTDYILGGYGLIFLNLYFIDRDNNFLSLEHEFLKHFPIVYQYKLISTFLNKFVGWCLCPVWLKTIRF